MIYPIQCPMCREDFDADTATLYSGRPICPECVKELNRGLAEVEAGMDKDAKEIEQRIAYAGKHKPSPHEL